MSEMIERVHNAIVNRDNSEQYSIAKAAIAAMREPTEEMCFAASGSHAKDDLDGMKETQQAMIDAALADQNVGRSMATKESKKAMV